MLLDPPEITLNPCNEDNNKYHVIEGYGAYFECEINANPGVTSTYWMKSYGKPALSGFISIARVKCDKTGK